MKKKIARVVRGAFAAKLRCSANFFFTSFIPSISEIIVPAIEFKF